MIKKAFLLADGEPLSKDKIEWLRRDRFTLVIDGAAEQVRKLKWLPDRITGDFDAARPSTLSYFSRRGVEIIPTPDQNYTDLEKAIAWCLSHNMNNVWIAQALGGRLDHSLVNLALLKRFYRKKRELVIFRETEKIRFAKDETLRLRGAIGRRIAIIPFYRSKVSSKGLLYEMEKKTLWLGKSESSSNAARSATIHLKIAGEALVIEEIDS